MEVDSSTAPSAPASLFQLLLELQGQIKELIGDAEGPKWLIKVIYRLQRTFAPSLAPALLKTRPFALDGYAMAALFTFCKFLIEAIEETPEKDDSANEFIQREYPGIYEYFSDRLKEINAEIAEAASLSWDDASAFFVAFGEGLKKETAFTSLQRMEDNQTVKFCFFLILQSPRIQAGNFSSVSKLADAFFDAQKLVGNLHYEENPEVKAAALSQFRRICSADGIRLRERGRPQKPIETGNVAAPTKAPPKKSRQKKPLSSGK